jgi:hypothetical protein
MKRPRLRFTLKMSMVAVAAAAIVLWWFKPESPESRSCRKLTQHHQHEAKLWDEYAELSGEAVTSLGPGILPDGRPAMILQFNHYIPRDPPQGAVERAAFDRECASIAAKCRIMAVYHDQLRRKWENAAWYPWQAVPPDPPPPIPLEADTIHDASY